MPRDRLLITIGLAGMAFIGLAGVISVFGIGMGWIVIPLFTVFLFFTVWGVASPRIRDSIKDRGIVFWVVKQIDIWVGRFISLFQVTDEFEIEVARQLQNRVRKADELFQEIPEDFEDWRRRYEAWKADTETYLEENVSHDKWYLFKYNTTRVTQQNFGHGIDEKHNEALSSLFVERINLKDILREYQRNP